MAEPKHDVFIGVRITTTRGTTDIVSNGQWYRRKENNSPFVQTDLSDFRGSEINMAAVGLTHYYKKDKSITVIPGEDRFTIYARVFDNRKVVKGPLNRNLEETSLAEWAIRHLEMIPKLGD